MNQSYNEKIPVEALEIIGSIEQAGFEAYIVGGCVRDMLMEREPNDWDITTSAKPEDVKNIFRRTYDTGIQHGTVTVILNKDHYEVTTYRIEGEYKDFRRPEQVDFVEDITLDLSRRDFTMNAIAYHPHRGFIDPYHGIGDISSQMIRSVRDAKERFTEDALRILRAVRFSAQLGFQIEADTIEGIKACKALLTHISKERIREEFVKICVSPRPTYITQLYNLQLLEYIIPEFIKAYETPQHHKHHLYNVADHTLVAMENVPNEPLLRLTVLLHDIGKIGTRTTDAKGVDHFYNHPKKSKDIAKAILKDLKFDNYTIRATGLLIENHDYFLRHKITPQNVKKLMNILDVELFEKLLLVEEADARAQNPDFLEKKLEAIYKQRQMKDMILSNNECYNKSMLAITGKDIIDQGIPRGEIIGILIDKSLDRIIAHPEWNTKEELISFCLQYYNNGSNS